MVSYVIFCIQFYTKSNTRLPRKTGETILRETILILCKDIFYYATITHREMPPDDVCFIPNWPKSDGARPVVTIGRR